ncbi:MAG: sigma-70 family RNA polymerase sigma factor [Chloroflexota bacterium]
MDYREPEEFSNMGNQELALAAKQGDREARNALFMRLRAKISRCTATSKHKLARLEQGPTYLEPEDLDQEAFIIFCDLIDSWQPQRAPFVPYALKMLRWRQHDIVRAGLSYRRKRLRVVRLPEPAYSEAAEHLVETQTPETLVEGTEEWNALLAQLQDDWRRFVELKFYRDFTTSRIASESNCSARTVDRSIRFALDLLRLNQQELWEVV